MDLHDTPSLTDLTAGWPVPAAVLAQCLRLGAATSVEVEVETKQGYVYTGRVTELDQNYNLHLVDAVVRRARICDIERQLRREREKELLGLGRTFTMLGSTSTEDGLPTFMKERPDSAARPRFVGAVVIRSSNLLLIDFSASMKPSSGGDVAPETKRGTTSGAKRKREELTMDPTNLRASFESMATAVRRSMAAKRQKDRSERRKRVGAAATKTKTETKP